METKSTTQLPNIGEPFEGGIYAGITLDGDQRAVLILLLGEEKKAWQAAGAWAKEQGGAHSSCLPSRIDMLVLLKNLRAEFKRDWYWTSEEVAGNAGYAWIQYFVNGGQNCNHKSHDYRCRAVRRVAI